MRRGCGPESGKAQYLSIEIHFRLHFFFFTSTLSVGPCSASLFKSNSSLALLCFIIAVRLSRPIMFASLIHDFLRTGSRRVLSSSEELR